MATIVLIHGAGHGAWCWERVVPALERRGREARALDLPRPGPDGAGASAITLDGYADAVCAALEDIAGPVCLVGHSLGGLTITRVGELAPERLSRLVYVTALLPRPGQTGREAIGDNPGSRLAECRVPSADGASYAFAPAATRELFYSECDPADAAGAAERLVPQPAAVATTPVHWTQARFGRVPRAYVICTRDRALVESSQRAMCAGVPCDPVSELDTDHSPFLSRVEELSDLLAGLAE